MAKMVDTKEYLDMVCGLLAAGQTNVPVPVAGTSMTPFLHSGDTVYLNLPDSPLKKGDIVLFTRPGGQYVLHRIVSVHRDGSFTLLGDAQREYEPVAGSEYIHARVTSTRHKDRLLTPKSRRWRFFATVWMHPLIVPLRRIILVTVSKFRS